MSAAAAPRKDPWDETMLRALNEAVAPLEAKLNCPEEPAGREHPVIFVVGVPRSGTTPLLQLIVHGFRAAYITNLTAQFPRAPALGLWLARRVGLWDQDQAFHSRFGRTSEPWGPHEFGYFWREMVGGDPLDEDVVRRMAADRLGRLVATLQRMACVAGRPLVLKGFTPGFIAARLADALPASLFVRIRRPAAEVEPSLLRMRREMFGSEDAWASLKPAGWEEAGTLSPADQVAAQVRGLDRAFDRELDQVPGDRVAEVEHRMLAEAPDRIVEHVGELLARAGVDPRPLRTVPHELLRVGDRSRHDRNEPHSDRGSNEVDA